MEILRRLLAAWKRAGKWTRISVIVAATLILQVTVTLVAINPVPGRGGGRDAEASGAIEEAREVGLSEFMKAVREHRLKSAVIDPERVEAEEKDGGRIVLNHDRWLFNEAFPRELVDAGVDVTFPKGKDDGRTLGDVLLTVTAAVMQLFLLVFLFAMGLFMWRQSKGIFSSGWPEITRKPTVAFADVAGQEESKFELAEIKTFLQDPDAYDRVGARPPRGILLIGPPGTGKTLLAKALAGEAGASFIAVSASDFSTMFVGLGRNKVEKLFREARKRAPCIVFIDEIDSMSRRRGGSSTDLARDADTTLNQLLVEMDGFKTKDGIIVVGATNLVEVLDPALLRPGRFDRHVHVGLPTIKGRSEILAVHTRDRPLAEDVDLDIVARGTPGFSGADLANLVNEASILAARVGEATISAAHFEEARDKAIMGLQRRNLALSEEERRLIAVHEAGHAVVATHLPGSDPVHQATIIPRGRSLGLVMRLPVRDRVITARERLDADLAVLMGGRAAEEVILGAGAVSSGAAADIAEATNIAAAMVSEWGMSDRIGMVRMTQPDSPVRHPVVDREIKVVIDRAYAVASDILTTYSDGLRKVADALYERESLDGSEIRRLLGRPDGHDATAGTAVAASLISVG